MDPDHELILTDGETGAQFTLQVNAEDYVRAMTDMTFAHKLLLSASEAAVASASSPERPQSAEVACDEVEENDELHEPQTAQKHEWQYEEVKCLLYSYEQHKDELSHPKKRKYTWDNIANDVNSNGYNVNAIICKNKWKNLLRTYKTAKDSKKRTGNAPSRFNFFNDLDDIIGKKPSNSCTHTLESSAVTPMLERPSTSKVEEDTHINDEDENPKKTPVEKNKQESVKKSKEKRHEERMQIAKEKLEVEKKKVELLQQYLNLKKQ